MKTLALLLALVGSANALPTPVTGTAKTIVTNAGTASFSTTTFVGGITVVAPSSVTINGALKVTGLVSHTGTVASETMASAANITFSGGGQPLGLPATPVGADAAASKAYVDAQILVSTTAGVTLQATSPGSQQTGNVNISGRIATGTIAVGSNTIPTTLFTGTNLLHLGGSYPKMLFTHGGSTMTALEFSPNGNGAGSSNASWMRMGMGDTAASAFLGSYSDGLTISVNNTFNNGGGQWIGKNAWDKPSWATYMRTGDTGASGGAFLQVDRYDIMRASVTLGQPNFQPYISIAGANNSGVDNISVRIPGGISGNASNISTDMFNVGASSFTVEYDGDIGLGTATGSGTQLFYCLGGTFAGNLCRGAACICTGGTATALKIYVR